MTMEAQLRVLNMMLPYMMGVLSTLAKISAAVDRICVVDTSIWQCPSRSMQLHTKDVSCVH